MTAKEISKLDRFYSPCGPCAICGHKDSRHRLWDALMDCPEGDKETAAWFDVSVEHVRAVREIRPYRRAK